MKRYIVLHHTADPSKKPQFDKVNGYHKGQGFPISKLGFYVGYHFFVGMDGTTKQARAENEVGAHCDAKNMNVVGIGICLAGDFSKQTPDHRQIISLERLVAELQLRHGIPDENILLHRECKKTDCPAVDLRGLLMGERLRIKAKKAWQAISNPRVNLTRKNSLRRFLDRVADAIAGFVQG